MRGAGWLTLAAVLVGTLNYGYSTSLTWLLPAHAYSVFISGQVVLTVCGTIAGACLPWLIAQGIAESPENALGRRASISFAALLGCLQGVVAAVVVVVVAGQFSSRPTQFLLCVSAFLVFFSAISVGYLQGLERFSLLAAFLVGEVSLKVAFGLMFVLGGMGATGALAGFGLSSLAVISGGALVMRGDLRWCAALLRRRDLWRRAGWLLGIQTGVVVFVNLDILLAGVMVAPGADLARYQVGTILGRIPVPLTVALATAVFPELSASQARSRPALGASARFFLRTTVPVALTIATMPQAVIGLLFPSSYGGISALLPITATTGVLLSAVYLTAIVYLAGRRFRMVATLLATGLAMHAAAIVAGLTLGGTRGLAFGTAAGGGCMLALLLFKGRRRLLHVGMPLGTAAVVALTATMLLLRQFPVAWVVGAGLVLLVSAWRVIRPRGPGEEPGPPPAALAAEDQLSSGEGRPLRILHLAFDDHRLPGSGGQSVRTFEVNRRLAQRHQVTVVTMNYRGAQRRVEEGVRYVQIGLPWGYFPRMISYLLCLPFAVWRHPSDLVVEDFAPPVSSMLVPLWTRRPVVGMVQWLFAEQKSRQYKLPFFLFERWGVRAHQRLIAVSSPIGARLQALNPSAQVDVIPNGVDEQRIISSDGRSQASVLFLGRMELEHKGLDLLLRAFAKIAPSVQTNLVIAGDGRDRERVRRLVEEFGLRDRIRLVGEVNGAVKSRLLTGARLVCVPSRFETSSLVSLEAQASGTPVLAFDIPALREVLAPDAGVLVPAFDVESYADAMLQLVRAPERCHAMGQAGRRFVERFHWDQIAGRQERVYLEAVNARSGTM